MPTNSKELNRSHQKKFYDSNKDDLLRNKVLRRVQTGSIPTKSSMEKYDITPEQVNDIRKQNGLEPHDFKCFPLRSKDPICLPPPTPEPQEPSKRGRKVGSHKGISMEHVRFYYQKLVDDGTMAQNSAKTYADQLERVLKELKGCEPQDDIVKCLKKSDQFLTLVNEKYTNANTKKAYLQAVLYAIDHYPSLKEKVSRKAYHQAWVDSKKNAETYNIDRQVNQEVPKFSEIIKKVYETYPEQSDARLMISLYNEITMRDDFGKVMVVNDNSKATTPNFVNIKTGFIHMNDYHKTKEKYGPVKIKLSKKLIDLIKSTRDVGEMLFSRANMSQYIGQVLKKSGVVGSGAINLLRHSKISEELEGSKIRSSKKRNELADVMKHSPVTQISYLRTLASK